MYVCMCARVCVLLLACFVHECGHVAPTSSFPIPTHRCTPAPRNKQFVLHPPTKHPYTNTHTHTPTYPTNTHTHTNVHTNILRKDPDGYPQTYTSTDPHTHTHQALMGGWVPRGQVS